MPDTYIGDLPDGGAIRTTDDIPIERFAANYRARVASAATKAASDTSEPLVASVSGATTVGNLAIFADEAGTVQDGGSPAAIITGATPLSPLLVTDLIPVVRGGVIYLAAISDVLAAQNPSSGGAFDFSDPNNSALAAAAF